jgi:hypothetical protein
MGTKLPISHRALLQRINRALKDEFKQVRRSRRVGQDAGRPLYAHGLGEYYLLNLRRNVIVAENLNLENYGKELKVLEDYEKLQEEDK